MLSTLVLSAGMTFVLAGCEDERSVVSAREYEFAIALDRQSAPEGTVTFHVANTGTELHEFVVIRTDLAPDALPTEPDGSYLEDGPGTLVVGEIEDIPPGVTEDLTLNLIAANYVIICNRVEVEEDGEVEAHYALGMRTAFAVFGDDNGNF